MIKLGQELASEVLPPVDAVIVTAMGNINEVEEKLIGKLDSDIISLKEILYGIS